MAARLSCAAAVFLFLCMSTAAAAEGGAARELWCVAKNNAEDAALQAALDWACGAGGADCGPIQNGGPCYDASDLPRTASYVFNDYYLKNRNSDDSCSFSNTAAVTDLNPSHAKCKFPSTTTATATASSGNYSSGMDSRSRSSSSSSCIGRCLCSIPCSFLYHYVSPALACHRNGP